MEGERSEKSSVYDVVDGDWGNVVQSEDESELFFILRRLRAYPRV